MGSNGDFMKFTKTTLDYLLDGCPMVSSKYDSFSCRTVS
jgi:hypothetical protein